MIHLSSSTPSSTKEIVKEPPRFLGLFRGILENIFLYQKEDGAIYATVQDKQGRLVRQITPAEILLKGKELSTKLKELQSNPAHTIPWLLKNRCSAQVQGEVLLFQPRLIAAGNAPSRDLLSKAPGWFEQLNVDVPRLLEDLISAEFLTREGKPGPLLDRMSGRTIDRIVKDHIFQVIKEKRTLITADDFDETECLPLPLWMDKETRLKVLFTLDHILFSNIYATSVLNPYCMFGPKKGKMYTEFISSLIQKGYKTAQFFESYAGSWYLELHEYDKSLEWYKLANNFSGVCKAFLNLGEYREALNFAIFAIKDNSTATPFKVPAYILKARIHFILREFKEAFKGLEDLDDVYGRYQPQPILYNRFHFYFRLWDLKTIRKSIQERKDYQHTIRDPYLTIADYAIVLYLSSECESAKIHFEEAIQLAEKRLSKFFDDPEEVQDFQDIATLQKLVETYRGHLLLTQGKAKEAIAEYEKSKKDLLFYGIALIEDGQYEEALEALNEEIKTNFSVWAYLKKAEALERLGRDSEAQEAYSEALKLNAELDLPIEGLKRAKREFDRSEADRLRQQLEEEEAKLQDLKVGAKEEDTLRDELERKQKEREQAEHARKVEEERERLKRLLEEKERKERDEAERRQREEELRDLEFRTKFAAGQVAAAGSSGSHHDRVEQWVSDDDDDGPEPDVFDNETVFTDTTDVFAKKLDQNIRELYSKRSETRRVKAASELGKMGNDRIDPSSRQRITNSLLDALSSEVDQVKKAIAGALLDIVGSKNLPLDEKVKIIEDLLHKIHEEDGASVEIRQSALKKLKEVSGQPGWEKSVGVFAKLLNESSEDEIRLSSAEILGTMGQKSRAPVVRDQIMESLVFALRRDIEEIKETASGALVVMATTHEGDDEQRIKIIESLGKLLKESNVRLRVHASKSLSKIFMLDIGPDHKVAIINTYISVLEQDRAKIVDNKEVLSSVDNILKSIGINYTKEKILNTLKEVAITIAGRSVAGAAEGAGKAACVVS